MISYTTAGEAEGVWGVVGRLGVSEGSVGTCVGYFVGWYGEFMCHVLQHHCRNCGKSVCGQCSGKRVSLPHFGVDEPTRVCDICYKKVEKG